jgi:hypothetical protein
MRSLRPCTASTGVPRLDSLSAPGYRCGSTEYLQARVIDTGAVAEMRRAAPPTADERCKRLLVGQPELNSSRQLPRRLQRAPRMHSECTAVAESAQHDA